MLSDHGTNFVAAEREFRELGEALDPKKKSKTKKTANSNQRSHMALQSSTSAPFWRGTRDYD